MILRDQILKERRIPALRKRREAHPQNPVRSRGVETGRLGDGNEPLIRRCQSRHGDRVTVEIALDICGAVLHGRRLPLRRAALIILGRERAALIAGTSGTGDEEIRAARVELDRKGLRRRSGADVYGAVVLLVEVWGFDLVGERLGGQSGV